MTKKEYEEMKQKYNMPMTYEEMVDSNREYDHPDSLNNFEATVIFIIVMLVSAIFKERLMVWIPAIIIYLKHMLRHIR